MRVFGVGLGHACVLLCLLSACQREIRINHRTPSGAAPSGASSDVNRKQNPAGEDSLDPSFDPGDPNAAAAGAVPFPNVSFSLQGTPKAASDVYRFEFSALADAAISHYAYKVSPGSGCDQPGGYTVSETRKPLTIDIETLPLGMINLCLIPYHFPTRQWRTPREAVVYSWEKIQFKRSINSYFEVPPDEVCARTKRVNVQLNVEGDKGTYLWQEQPVDGCVTDPATYSAAVSSVKVSATDMTGLWHEAETLTGWFHFKFTNPERTQFTGGWGYGELDVKREGVWNSVPPAAP